MLRTLTASALLVAAALPAQSTARPAAAAPLSASQLAMAFADAVPYAAFVAGDTTKRALWEANYAAAPAVVAEALRATPAPPGRWRLLVVGESACNDAVNSVPYLARLAEAIPGAELRLLRRADGEAIVQRHLYEGRAATPVVVVLDGEFRARGAWIERPAAQQAFVKANEGKLSDDSLWTVVRRMRADDGGRSALREVLALMRGTAAGPATARQPTVPPKAAPGAAGKKAFEKIEPCKLP